MLLDADYLIRHPVTDNVLRQHVADYLLRQPVTTPFLHVVPVRTILYVNLDGLSFTSTRDELCSACHARLSHGHADTSLPLQT